MNYIFIFLALIFNRYHVSGTPLTSTIFKGIFGDATTDSRDDSEKVEVELNQLPEIHDPNMIDLSTYGYSLYGHPDFNKTGNLVAKFKPNKTSVNPEELGSYVEGDILIPHKIITLKSGLSSRAYYWPNGEIPFEISGDFTRNELNVIAFAIDEYHKKTCVRFKPRTVEFDYISIARGYSGCWSAIGRVGGKQPVNLQAPGCLIKPGTAIHELMHVLGFMHEQNRKERDSFVEIQFQNVQRNAWLNFEKVLNTDGFGVGYDYGSVMHYSSKAFSSNGLPTILAKQPVYTQIMGQREGFSSLDIEKINRMYNCKDNSKPTEPPIKLSVRLPPRFSFFQRFSNNRL